MRISELINRLEDIKDKNGDIIVRCFEMDRTLEPKLVILKAYRDFQEGYELHLILNAYEINDKEEGFQVPGHKI